MSDSADGSCSTTTHPKFNDTVMGTDTLIRSSDGVMFHLHRKYLEVNANIPIPVFDGLHTTIFDEPCNVLEILFQFIYPGRQPTLEDTDFETLMVVAEAVEKYQVFSAMNLYEVRLKRFLPCDEHATRIFIHAIKYNYPKLADEAALCICRKPDLEPEPELLHQLSSAQIVSWLKYREAWRTAFDIRLQSVIMRCHSNERFQSCVRLCASPKPVCTICTTSTLAWFQFLENLDRLSDLKSWLVALINESNLSSQYQLVSKRFGNSNFPYFSTKIGGICGKDRCQDSSRCVYMIEELKKLQQHTRRFRHSLISSTEVISRYLTRPPVTQVFEGKYSSAQSKCFSWPNIY